MELCGAIECDCELWGLRGADPQTDGETVCGSGWVCGKFVGPGGGNELCVHVFQRNLARQWAQ